MLEGGVNLLTVSALLGHTQVTTTNTYLQASGVLAEKEVREFRRKHGKLYPGITPGTKTDRSVKGKTKSPRKQKGLRLQA